MDLNQIEISMFDSVASDKLKDLSADLLEVGLDSVLENGFLKDIPLFGALLKLHGAAVSIKERLFFKKIYTFLCGLKCASVEKRQAVIESIAKKKGGHKAAGLVIIQIIDRLDDMDKPALIGKLFVACAEGRINADQLLRYSNIISGLYIDDLRKLSKLNSSSSFTQEENNIYASHGLMVYNIVNPLKPNHPGGGFMTSELAKAIFDEPINLSYTFTDDAKLIAEICFSVNSNTTKKLF